MIICCCLLKLFVLDQFQVNLGLLKLLLQEVGDFLLSVSDVRGAFDVGSGNQ
jgi:hypothetical protein